MGQSLCINLANIVSHSIVTRIIASAVPAGFCQWASDAWHLKFSPAAPCYALMPNFGFWVMQGAMCWLTPSYYTALLFPDDAGTIIPLRTAFAWMTVTSI